MLALLGYGAYQDFKFRELSIILFPFLFLAGFLRCCLLFNFQEALVYTSINILLICIQLSALYIYLYLTGKRHKLIFERFFGLGDVFMLLSITPAFSTFLFLVFCILSFSCSIFYAGLTHLFKFKNTTQIPLAGIIATLLFFLLLISFFSPCSHYFYSDTLVLSRMNL